MEVAGDGLQNVLPGAGGYFVADGDGLAGGEGPETVGYDAVGGPVSAADDVAGAGTGEEDEGVGTGEVGSAVGSDGDFRSSFAGTVGIVPAHGVLLAIGVEPLAVFITLIRGDHDGHAGMGEGAEGIHDVDGAHDVGDESGDGDVVGKPDEGLGGEVKDEIRLEGSGEGGEARGVGQVAPVVGGKP